MKVSDLKSPPGAKKNRKRKGRGPGSGHGKTSGRGHKGQKARSRVQIGFEGGQMPLIRRLPKRGFTHSFKKQFQIVHLLQLNTFKEKSTVTPEMMRENGLIKRIGDGVKVLGDGKLSRPLVVKAHRFSKSALEKIEKAGGKAEIVTNE